MDQQVESDEELSASSPPDRDSDRPLRPTRKREWRVFGFFKKHYVSVVAWASVTVLVVISYLTGFDREITAGLVLVIGLATQIFGNFFNYLMSLVGLIPVVGPMIVKVVTLPFFFIINALSFIVAFFGLRMGEAKTVASSRLMATTLLIGIIIGYIIGRMVG